MWHRTVSFFKKLDLDTRLTISGLVLLLLTWLMDFFKFGPSFDRFSFLFLLVLRSLPY